MIGWILFALALALLILALRLRRTTGVPWARVAATDTRAWRQTTEPLISRTYGIVGKPDYVIETRAGQIPIEVKPSRTAATPYDSDLMQLAAYCLLIEETTGRAPRYGLLRYAHQTFRLPYDSRVRSELIDLLAAMRDDADAADVARSHDQPARCRGCGFYDMCTDALD